MHTLSAAHFTALYPEMVLSQFFISPVPDHEVCANSPSASLPHGVSTWASLYLIIFEPLVLILPIGSFVIHL